MRPSLVPEVGIEPTCLATDGPKPPAYTVSPLGQELEAPVRFELTCYSVTLSTGSKPEVIRGQDLVLGVRLELTIICL